MSPTRQELPDGKVIEVPTHFAGRAKLNKHRTIREQKLSRVHEAHVADLNAFVERIRSEQDAYVPWIDPDSAGVAAQVLFVLEAPGRQTLISQMVSLDNNDETAKAMWQAYSTTGMSRATALHWNAVPWYVGTEQRNRTPSAAEIAQGRPYLAELVGMLPALRCVVALGRPAQQALRPFTAQWDAAGIVVLSAPHPSLQVANLTNGESRREIHQAMLQAMLLTGTGRLGVAAPQRCDEVC